LTKLRLFGELGLVEATRIVAMLRWFEGLGSLKTLAGSRKEECGDGEEVRATRIVVTARVVRGARNGGATRIVRASRDAVKARVVRSARNGGAAEVVEETRGAGIVGGVKDWWWLKPSDI